MTCTCVASDNLILPDDLQFMNEDKIFVNRKRKDQVTN